MTIFSELRALRKAAGLSQLQASEQTKLSCDTIKRLESGANYTRKTLEKYAALFRKKVEEGFILTD
jgi:transcriptional regulator with XRE-family HTH domain